MHYIKQLCDSFILACKDKKDNKYEGIHVFTWPKMIFQEIGNLKTTDFSPAERYSFVIIRQQFYNLSNLLSFNDNQLPDFITKAQRLNHILDFYNPGTEAFPRNFDFISDAELKAIIQRDYKELQYCLLPDGAWKSSVIMAGSILESILFDVLSNSTYLAAANNSSKAPKKNGAAIDISTGKWKLVNLIEVAEDINVLPSQRVASIDQVLRDYRNFVHPKKEIKSQHPCTEAEAFMAKGSLDGLCNHLEKLLS